MKTMRDMMKRAIILYALTFYTAQAVAEDGVVDWYYLTNDKVYGSPAVAEDGRIYVGSKDGNLYALNADGSFRWAYLSEDWVDSSPAIGADGIVYFGSWDGFVYAVDGDTGLAKWIFSTDIGGDNLFLGSPSIGADGTIYIGAFDSYLYAIDSVSGKAKWSYLADGEIEGSVAIDAEGYLYFGTLNGTLYSLDASGSLRWRLALADYSDNEETDHEIHSSVALSDDGRLYVGSRNGYLFAFDTDGNYLWKYEAADYVDSSPVVGPDGSVYFGSRDGYLYKIGPLGLFEWELEVGDIYYSSPLVGESGLIYVASEAGDNQTRIAAVDSGGVIEWQTSLPLYNDASIAITKDGHLLVGQEDGGLYALTVSDTLAAEASWPKFGSGLEQRGRLLIDTDPILSIFFGVEAHADDWYFVNWLGWFNGAFYPWVSHFDHGWLFVGNATPGSMWIYDQKQGWLYFSEGLINYLYRKNTDSWLYYQPGTSVYTGGRWFFDYGTGAWEQESLL